MPTTNPMAKPRPNAAAVEATLANRRSLNANRRTATPGNIPSAVKESLPRPNPAAGMPNAVPPRLQAMAAKDPAAAQARYAQFQAGQLPGQVPQAMTKPLQRPPAGVTDIALAHELPVALPPAGPISQMPPAGSSPPGDEIAAQIATARQAAPMNPQFSANLPPEIMQRLTALRAGGTMGALVPGGLGTAMAPGLAGAVTGSAGGAGMAKPGMPGQPPFNFADYWSQGGGQPMPWAGGGGGAGPIGSYAK